MTTTKLLIHVTRLIGRPKSGVLMPVAMFVKYSSRTLLYILTHDVELAHNSGNED